MDLGFRCVAARSPFALFLSRFAIDRLRFAIGRSRFAMGRSPSVIWSFAVRIADSVPAGTAPTPAARPSPAAATAGNRRAKSRYFAIGIRSPAAVGMSAATLRPGRPIPRMVPCAPACKTLPPVPGAWPA